MNNRSHYSSSSRSMIPHPPLNLPSIHLLFQIADSPAASPQPSSLTLPPLRMSQAYHDHRPFYSTSPTGSSSSTSSTRASSTSTASSSPQSQEYSRPTKRKQVKRACQNCQKVHDFILRSTSFSMGAPLHQACKGCADTRPCPRCIVHGITESCVDAPRKSDRKSKGPERENNGELSTR
ncbi:hypothetical protein H4Q26_001472 [Puccinia striiformis f. sp. tritici PST-130]|nr:hypothetical protein H4Q26_001472 [Puccinia striiformis f. sp. tritici PST-130]